MNREPLTTREVARAAVRASLASVANELFRRYGFHNVTIDDVAAAAGVHRTTFLRYFPTKEDAVVGFWDEQADVVADTLRTRPADEDDWTALELAFGVCLEPVRQDPAPFFVMASSASLWRRMLEKQSFWRPNMARALAERGGASTPATLKHKVRVATALACLNVALRRWIEGEGQVDLDDLLSEAFTSLGATTRASRRPSSWMTDAAVKHSQTACDR